MDDRDEQRWPTQQDSKIDELISVLDVELDVQECHSPILKILNGNNEEQRWPTQQESQCAGGPSTASALFTTNGSIKTCIFCEDNHNSGDCIVDKDPKSRKTSLRKQFTCFLCLKGGHRSFECRSKIKYSFCKVKHHTAICSSKLPKVVVKDAQPLNPEASSWVGSACSGNAVALQTALTNVEGKDGRSVRVV